MKKGELMLAFALLVISTSLVSAQFAPEIGELDSEYTICEATSFSQEFIATDLDGQALIPDISPKGPFHTRVLSTDPQKTIIEIYSTEITKELTDRVFEETLTVSDGTYSDSRKIVFKTFETNNKPLIEPLTVTTVSLDRSKNFLKQVHVTDIESGDQDSGKLKFAISADNLSISISDTGLINGSFNSDDVGAHEVNVCVTDSGVENIEGKIGFCGTSEVIETVCESFQLSITDVNNQPTILTFNATNQSDRFPGKTQLIFEVIKFDPDEIIPDTHWYVDNEIVEIDIGETKDSFYYEFGCDIWGRHKVRAEVTDGLDRDSIEWIYDITKVNCAEDDLPGGIVGETRCVQELACGDWDLCQNAAQSAELGYVNAKDFELIKNDCTRNNWTGEFCGLQLRQCSDLNACGLNNNFEFQACYFSVDPTCSDGLKNCHSNLCETATDCGGPCDACATCSDGQKNQGEEHIDCGGPCATECPEVIVTPEEVKNKKIVLIVIGVLAIIVGLLVFFIMREKRKLEEPSIHDKPLKVSEENKQNAQQ